MSNVVKVHRMPVRVGVPKILVGRPSDDAPRTQSNLQTLNSITSASQPEKLDDAYERGWKQGKVETEQQMRLLMEQAIANERERISKFLASLEVQLREFHATMEEHIVRFSLAVAEKIVKREIIHDREFVLTQVREALKRVVGVARVKLRVHPNDEAIVRSNRTTVTEGLDSLREIIVEVDETIEPGGCIIESESGNVDARLSTQLKQIEEALMERKEP